MFNSVQIGLLNIMIKINPSFSFGKKLAKKEMLKFLNSEEFNEYMIINNELTFKACDNVKEIIFEIYNKNEDLEKRIKSLENIFLIKNRKQKEKYTEIFRNILISDDSWKEEEFDKAINKIKDNKRDNKNPFINNFVGIEKYFQFLDICSKQDYDEYIQLKNLIKIFNYFLKELKKGNKTIDDESFKNSLKNERINIINIVTGKIIFSQYSMLFQYLFKDSNFNSDFFSYGGEDLFNLCTNCKVIKEISFQLNTNLKEALFNTWSSLTS